MKNKAEIVIELNETIILENSGEPVNAYCPECKKIVEMITPKLCAFSHQISEREIFRLIEAKKIHFNESKEILVCKNSVKEGVKQF